MFSRHIKQLAMYSLFKCILTLHTVCLHKKDLSYEAWIEADHAVTAAITVNLAHLCRGIAILPHVTYRAFANYGTSTLIWIQSSLSTMTKLDFPLKEREYKNKKLEQVSWYAPFARIGNIVKIVEIVKINKQCKYMTFKLARNYLCFCERIC